MRIRDVCCGHENFLKRQRVNCGFAVLQSFVVAAVVLIFVLKGLM